jgi:hypothetical protein
MRFDKIREVAQTEAVTAGRLSEVLDEIEANAKRSLDDFLDSAWNGTGSEFSLVAETGGSYVFAVDSATWETISEKLSLNDREVSAAKTAHREHASDLLVTTAAARRSFDERDALVVGYPENWEFCREMMEWQFSRWAFYELSPAEILDYWMVEERGWPPQQWSNDRQVGAEAVRKNVRQAREKLGK